jgi:hypothetical protein
MSLEFAYSLDGSAVSNIKDFALDTAANYKAAGGTNDVKKGDLIYLDATTGLVRRTGATTNKAIGVLEGTEFLGLVASGQPFAATNASLTASAVDTTRYPSGVAKIRTESDSVYRIPVNTGTVTNANLGKAYGVILDAAGDQKLDTSNVTQTVLKVIDFSKDGKTAFVMMSSNTTF